MLQIYNIKHSIHSQSVKSYCLVRICDVSPQISSQIHSYPVLSAHFVSYPCRFAPLVVLPPLKYKYSLIKTSDEINIFFSGRLRGGLLKLPFKARLFQKVAGINFYTSFVFPNCIRISHRGLILVFFLFYFLFYSD